MYICIKVRIVRRRGKVSSALQNHISIFGYFKYNGPKCKYIVFFFSLIFFCVQSITSICCPFPF